jgi:hypothetical protein
MPSHDGVRVDLGTPALTHLDALGREDHALVAKPLERLGVLRQAQVAKDLGEESGVE